MHMKHLKTFLWVGLWSLRLLGQDFQQLTSEAFLTATMTYDTHELEQLLDRLGREADRTHNHRLVYWTAYASYRNAIAAAEIHQKQPEELKKAGRELSASMKRLEKLAGLTSEDLALLALMKNVSVLYCSSIRIPILSGEARRCAESALQADGRNPRAWLALGIRDRHTPEVYGGGQQFVDCFQKAIDLPDTDDAQPGAPSWGREEAYYYLIEYYLSADREKAARLLEQGLGEFPEDVRLNHLAKLI